MTLELLTPAELDALVRVMAEAGLDEDEAGRVYEWACGVKTDVAILKMVLSGRAVARWPEGTDDLLVSLP